MYYKVLLIDTVHEIIPEKLKKSGFTVAEAYKESKIEIQKFISEYCGIVIRSRFNIDKEFIDCAKNLKFIARVGAGMESIDTDYCNKKGIVCLNSPEGNRDAVGEHAVAMLLSLLNNLPKANKEMKLGIRNREENRGSELGSKVVAIIGYGNMGSSFAKKLSGFGCKVIAYDKYKKNYSNQFVKETDYKEIFEKADILSLHVPLTAETKFLVNSEFIAKFKKPIILINTARGQVVKTSDLVDALKSEKILAAGLDVLEYEDASFETTIDLKDNPDFQHHAKSENVILTPHIAGWTYESKTKLAEILVDKIINLKI